ncbi:hypothetical protein AWC01_14515 [Mycobacterium doricum]|uniref:Uncharacterized protein n=1 Tax=Mycolicibacterium doricum TaxID=126673 RepID=A0A1X1T2I3_9MYCO|nr:hypothetical protein AWC01_14515 [Mycolicibacterium doricum]
MKNLAVGAAAKIGFGQCRHGESMTIPGRELNFVAAVAVHTDDGPCIARDQPVCRQVPGQDDEFMFAICHLLVSRQFRYAGQRRGRR